MSTELDDFQPKPEVRHPETIEHWTAWLAIGMVLILHAKSFAEAREIANARLRAATDPIHGIKAFPFDIVNEWRSVTKKTR